MDETIINQEQEMQVAVERIVGFTQQFDETHLLLASHAAFPLSLTPDLLYQIWANFVPEAPWVGVARVLLSVLCKQVGYELYEMDNSVRNLLLRNLKLKYGQKRFDLLSDFLLKYIKQRLIGDDPDTKNLREAQEWTTLAYTNPKQAALELAKALSTFVEHNNIEEIFRLSSLIETLSDPLVEAGFQPLLIYSKGCFFSSMGKEYDAQNCFNKINNYFQVGELQLFKPKKFQRIIENFEVITVNSRGKEIKRVEGKAECWRINLDSNTTLSMINIPGGTFWMGSDEDEKGHYGNESPRHSVTIQPFFMGKYPITQAQWRVIANLPKIERDLNLSPSRFKGDNRPVEKVSWYDAMEFCARLSKLTSEDFSLPSEAEWEYACRAGTTTPFYFGETITDDFANYNASYIYAEEASGQNRKETTDVGSFPPNIFGLYDMHGNVWEWCKDNSHDDYIGTPNDGTAWLEKYNTTCIMRGGSWLNLPRNCRSAVRFNYDARDDYNNFTGFRVKYVLIKN